MLFTLIKNIRVLLLLCFGLCAGFSFQSVEAMSFEMSTPDALMIAERVFKNECFSQQECWIEWNAGEDFLSLGMGHFIWYPKQGDRFFEESFPAYLEYAAARGAVLPSWLDQKSVPFCPWPSRDIFLSDRTSSSYQDLLDFLFQTKHYQAEYIVERAKMSIRQIIDALPEAQRPRITKDLSWLLSQAHGVYALIDYINFKGTGLCSSERFQQEGWGLLQVLQGMRGSESPQEALAEFARSAKAVLERRVSLAPSERNEERWLPGWLRRIDTYMPENI